jgi:xylulokinase
VLCGLLDGRDALRHAGASVDGRIFVVGGGSRSIAYRQRCADLSGQAVVVPDTDETVATGAAVQAAAAVGAGSLDDVAVRWRLGAGVTVEPGRDATGRRTAYTAFATSV